MDGMMTVNVWSGESQEIEMYWHPLLEDKTYTLFNPIEEGRTSNDIWSVDDLYLNVLNNHEKEVIYIRQKEEIEDGYEDRNYLGLLR